MALSILAAITLTPGHLDADIPPKELTIEETMVKYSVEDTIIKYAEEFGASAIELLSVSNCESKFNPNIKGDYKNGVYLALGEFQIHKPTFIGWEKLYFNATGEHLDYYSSHDRVKLTAWIWVNHPEYKWSWTSYRALMNGGTYSFYSSLLGKHFTVHCKLL